MDRVDWAHFIIIITHYTLLSVVTHVASCNFTTAKASSLIVYGAALQFSFGIILILASNPFGSQGMAARWFIVVHLDTFTSFGVLLAMLGSQLLWFLRRHRLKWLQLQHTWFLLSLRLISHCLEKMYNYKIYKSKDKVYRPSIRNRCKLIKNI